MTKYNDDRLGREYVNYVSNSIYNLKHEYVDYFGITIFEKNGKDIRVSDFDAREGMECLNFLFPDEFEKLVNGLSVNAIKFSNKGGSETVSDLMFNKKYDVPFLYIFPYDVVGRSYVYTGENFFMRFDFSSRNSSGEIHTYFTFTEMRPEGLYVCSQNVVKFISVADLEIIYNETYSSRYSFADFLRIVPYAYELHTRRLMFKKIDVPNDDILFDKKPESFNFIAKLGFVNYLKSKSYNLPVDINYDNEPLFADGYSELRDEISRMKR